MDPADVLRARLTSQLVAPAVARSPLAVVEWFGAMQAQDLDSALWSIGVRSGMTRAEVEQAARDRQILRTWPMRGTIHFVPAVDAHWMLELTGSRALRTAAKRRSQLGLDDVTAHRAADVLGTSLAERGCLDRSECTAELQRAGIPTDGQRGYHLLWFTAQLGVTCIGPQRGKQQTFVLLDEWVPQPRRLERDDALRELCVRYVRSHGPVTHRDFARWTGLTLSDATRAVAAAGNELVRLPGTDGLLMSATIADSLPPPRAPHPSDMRLLPGFDELILGYRDRAPMVAAEFADRIVPGNNGIFMPTIADAGRVVGTWKRATRGKTVKITIDPFDELTDRQHRGVNAAAEEYRRFLGVDHVAIG